MHVLFPTNHYCRTAWVCANGANCFEQRLIALLEQCRLLSQPSIYCRVNTNNLTASENTHCSMTLAYADSRAFRSISRCLWQIRTPNVRVAPECSPKLLLPAWTRHRVKRRGGDPKGLVMLETRGSKCGERLSGIAELSLRALHLNLLTSTIVLATLPV